MRRFINKTIAVAEQKRTAAFTLVEVLIGLGMLGLTSAGTFWAFNVVNNYAVSTRLYTTAQAVAQNQIDELLSTGPFDPGASTPKIPLELRTTAELDALVPQVPTEPTGAAPYWDYYRTAGGPLTKQAFVYRDPATNQPVVVGTLTTTVVDTDATVTDYNGVVKNMNLWRATVTVDYTFRSRNYSVTMNTLRTADQ